MGTEREPDHPADLDEAQRKLAEEEEKRRAAEAVQGAAMAQGGYYGPLRDTQRQVDDEHLNRTATRNESAAKLERWPEDELENFERRSAAKREELQEQYQRGHISAHDVRYELRKFENQLELEWNRRDELRGQESASTPERRDENNAGEARPQTNAESDLPSAQPASRVDRTDARAARLARLRDIHDEIVRQNEDQGLNQTRDAGDRSR